MVLVKINFGSNHIVDMNVYMPQAPHSGDDIELPYDTVKYTTGEIVEDRRFKVKNVEWCFRKADTLEFSHVEVWVERN